MSILCLSPFVYFVTFWWHHCRLMSFVDSVGFSCFYLILFPFLGDGEGFCYFFQVFGFYLGFLLSPSSFSSSSVFVCFSLSSPILPLFSLLHLLFLLFLLPLLLYFLLLFLPSSSSFTLFLLLLFLTHPINSWKYLSQKENVFLHVCES